MRLPYRIHGLAKGMSRDYLVQIEHTLLLAVYERALVTLESEIASTTPPKFSDSRGAHKWQTMQHDHRLYTEMVAWLRTLTV